VLDIIILILLALAAFSGWRAGAITMLLSVVILLAAAYFASMFALQAGNILKIGSEWARPTIGFAFVFLVLMIIGAALKRAIKPKSGISRSLDQALGAVLGIVRGVIILSFIFLLIARFDLPKAPAIEKSMLYKPILSCSTSIATVLKPMLHT
jgi:membrane protein required for colicin V production